MHVSVLVWLLLEPTTDHHLGKILPQILANEMRASSLADSFFFCFSAYKAVAAENPTSRPTCISLNVLEYSIISGLSYC